MKSNVMERIQRRFGELSKAGLILDGDLLRRVRRLPLLHLMKLAGALEGQAVGVARFDSWPSSIVESILVSSDD